MRVLTGLTHSGSTGSIICILASGVLAACGGGGSSTPPAPNPDPPAPSPSATYTVAGTISGLGTSGLVLTDNGGDSLSEPSGAIDFTFQTALANGTAYDVAVATQPTGETCSVANGSGTINDSDVAHVQIACSSNASTTASERVLYSFSGGSDGSEPYGGVIMDSAGNLYGTTNSGGAYGYGTVFKLTPSGTETVLYSFTGFSDGGHPDAGLTMDSAGNLYGTAAVGGSSGGGSGGVVFKVAPSGAETVLYAFGSGCTFLCTDGEEPESSLVFDSGGNLYGTTALGGSAYDGTVFKLAPSGTETVLHSFTGGSDGAFPRFGLVMDSAGNLYGTTQDDGTGCGGTVFEVTPSSAFIVVYGLGSSGTVDGCTASSGLTLDSAGDLYGETRFGGSDSDAGAVYKVLPGGAESVLYAFSNSGNDAIAPGGGLTLDSAGNLYGTAETGSVAIGGGAVFRITPSGGETVLYSFSGGADGGIPEGGLTMDSAGNLYGTTKDGGAYGYGTVFKITP